ncbi:hypothetical protein HDU85_006202 [Gaertneriomyces sp. JEL0708]|nr:hypothetical protein HDU85_006202 [Gaertneriomyces sp. JEL0708]
MSGNEQGPNVPFNLPVALPTVSGFNLPVVTTSGDDSTTAPFGLPFALPLASNAPISSSGSPNQAHVVSNGHQSRLQASFPVTVHDAHDLNESEGPIAKGHVGGNSSGRDEDSDKEDGELEEGEFTEHDTIPYGREAVPQEGPDSHGSREPSTTYDLLTMDLPDAEDGDDQLTHKKKKKKKAKSKKRQHLVSQDSPVKRLKTEDGEAYKGSLLTFEQEQAENEKRIQAASQMREDAFKAKASKTPCEFYAAGGCKMGEHCPFSHAGPGATFEESKPCRFFKSGSCVRGAHCPWSHDMKIEPCVFFHFKKGCVKGDDCPFSHAEITEEQRQVLEHEQQRWKQKVEGADSNLPTQDEDQKGSVSELASRSTFGGREVESSLVDPGSRNAVGNSGGGSAVKAEKSMVKDDEALSKQEDDEGNDDEDGEEGEDDEDEERSSDAPRQNGTLDLLSHGRMGHSMPYHLQQMSSDMQRQWSDWQNNHQRMGGNMSNRNYRTRPCIYFHLVKDCWKGEKCTHSHAPISELEFQQLCAEHPHLAPRSKGYQKQRSPREMVEQRERVEKKEWKVKDGRSHVPCYFYHLGRGCINGDKCPHSHEKLSAEEMERFLESQRERHGKKRGVDNADGRKERYPSERHSEMPRRYEEHHLDDVGRPRRQASQEGFSETRDDRYGQVENVNVQTYAAHPSANSKFRQRTATPDRPHQPLRPVEPAAAFVNRKSSAREQASGFGTQKPNLGMRMSDDTCAREQSAAFVTHASTMRSHMPSDPIQASGMGGSNSGTTMSMSSTGVAFPGMEMQMSGAGSSLPGFGMQLGMPPGAGLGTQMTNLEMQLPMQLPVVGMQMPGMAMQMPAMGASMPMPGMAMQMPGVGGIHPDLLQAAGALLQAFGGQLPPFPMMGNALGANFDPRTHDPRLQPPQ